MGIRTEDCNMPIVIPAWIIIGSVTTIGGVVILLGSVFWLRNKTIKPARKSTIRNVLKSGRSLIGKKLIVEGVLFSRQGLAGTKRKVSEMQSQKECVYVLQNDSGSLWAYGSEGIKNGKCVVEGTLKKTDKGLRLFIEKNNSCLIIQYCALFLNLFQIILVLLEFLF